jgi:hypothetical protein
LQPSKKTDEKVAKNHKTSIDWTIQVLKQLRHWELTRRFIFLVDGGFSSFELVHECCSLQITMIFSLHIDARLYDFPPKPIKGKRGPKPKKGDRLFLKNLAKNEFQPWKKIILPWY